MRVAVCLPRATRLRNSRVRFGAVTMRIQDNQKMQKQTNKLVIRLLSEYRSFAAVRVVLVVETAQLLRPNRPGPPVLTHLAYPFSNRTRRSARCTSS